MYVFQWGIEILILMKKEMERKLCHFFLKNVVICNFICYNGKN